MISQLIIYVCVYIYIYIYIYIESLCIDFSGVFYRARYVEVERDIYMYV